MPIVVVFWTTSTMKDEKSDAKFHYIKTVSGKVVEHSIAFRVVSMVGGRPLPPEILRASDLPSPVNGILLEDVRTHNSRTDRRRIFKLGGGVDHVTRHV